MGMGWALVPLAPSTFWEGPPCPSSPRQVLRFLLAALVKKMDEVGQKEAISNGMGTTNPCWEEFSPVEKGSQLGRGYKPCL